MRIVLATGIYPPQIGGPALYAKGLEDVLRKAGHDVSVVYVSWERVFPAGIRHLVFFLRLVLRLSGADCIIALDQFSVGLPSAFASRLFNVKLLIRLGGDFLWESHVERTGTPVLLRDFYGAKRPKLSVKERIIFRLIKWALRSASALIWSTPWQRDISVPAYGLEASTCHVIENQYPPRQASEPYARKNFVLAGRPIKLKNFKAFRRAFQEAKKHDPALELDEINLPHDELYAYMRRSYAVAIPSWSEVSPNLALEALSVSVPVLITKECGLAEKLRDVAVFLDPLSERDMTEKILLLAKSETYAEKKQAIAAFSFVHTYDDIAREFLDIYKKL